jgi:hypothetical protein
MTKPTPEQVEQCDDLDQLNEWAAVYCMVWKLHVFDDETNGVHEEDWITSNYQFKCAKGQYHPCSPTLEGKAQAYDLGIKFGTFPVKSEESGLWHANWGVIKLDFPQILFSFVEHEKPQVAQVKAAIISAVSEDK